MRRTVLLFALVLSMFASGCMTTRTIDWANTRDAYHNYTGVYSDGKHLAAVYSPSGRGPADRWTEIDMRRLQWVPFNPPLSIVDFRKAYTYSVDERMLKPADLAGWQKISLHVESGATQMASGELHRKEPARQPFTAYVSAPDGADGYMLLIRDDADHPGELEATQLKEDNGPHAVRLAATPFSLAADIVTLPVQLLLALIAALTVRS